MFKEPDLRPRTIPNPSTIYESFEEALYSLVFLLEGVYEVFGDVALPWV